jgi:hypothetical protein
MLRAFIISVASLQTASVRWILAIPFEAPVRRARRASRPRPQGPLTEAPSSYLPAAFVLIPSRARDPYRTQYFERQRKTNLAADERRSRR